MSFRLFDCDALHEIFHNKSKRYAQSLFVLFWCSFIDLSSFEAVTDVCSKAMVIFKRLFFFSLLYLCVVSFSVFALHCTLYCTLHCASAAVGYKAVLLLLMVSIAQIGCGTYVLGSCFVVSFLFFKHLPKEEDWLLYLNCVGTVCFLCHFLIRVWVVCVL